MTSCPPAMNRELAGAGAAGEQEPHQGEQSPAYDRHRDQPLNPDDGFLLLVHTARLAHDAVGGVGHEGYGTTGIAQSVGRVASWARERISFLLVAESVANLEAWMADHRNHDRQPLAAPVEHHGLCRSSGIERQSGRHIDRVVAQGLRGRRHPHP